MPKQLHNSTSDIYQIRYTAHQEKKKEQLKHSIGDSEYPILNNKHLNALEDIIEQRRSQRVFVTSELDPEQMDILLRHVSQTPSSCNRQAITLSVIEGRHDKEILSGLLVGGVGWCHRAGGLLLIFADKQAYKAPGEIRFMPYLDAGVVIQQIYMTTTVLNLGCAYINPNIRTENQKYFDERFNPNNHIFCGAIALGEYDVKAKKTEKRSKEETLYY